MLFSSLTFLFYFIPIVLLLYFVLPRAARNYWLLLASLVFYAWGEPRFVIVMLASICINYVLARLIDSARNAGKPRLSVFWLVLSLAVNLGNLFVNKYLNFFTYNLNHLFGIACRVTALSLPIGISFFTFQEMSYVIDVYRGDVDVQKNPFYLGLYVSFFPQLIAGPIVRYSTIAQEIRTRQVTISDFATGCRRFIAGLAKKILLANSFSVVADKAFALGGGGELSVLFAWLGAISYSLQIFFDFSGYSDMAIGLGRMFGFHFLENFNYPYISKSISEFWRRWHISLGTWFRDYVYVPLGGSRVGSKERLVWNLFVVWALTGVWHGANWTFVLWGLFYFALIAFEKLTGWPDKLESRVCSILYQVFTMLCVIGGWVIFRAETVGAGMLYLSDMLGIGKNALLDGNALFYWREYAVLLVVAVVCCTPLGKLVRTRLLPYPRLDAAVEWIGVAWYALLLLLCISSLVMGGNNPFIYFNF